jgi:hypothetical protein
MVIILRARRKLLLTNIRYQYRRMIMARKRIKKRDQQRQKEEELTPDEIADLLTGGCDNLGLS